MGLFRRKRTEDDAPAEKRSSFRLPTGPSVYGLGSYAGEVVTNETATRAAASWACIRVLKTTVASLPVDQVRRQNGRRIPVDNPSPIVVNPAGYGSRRVWVAQQMHSLLTDGNAYGMIVAGDPRNPTQIETVDPCCVRWQKSGGPWQVFVDNVEQALFPLGPLVHIPASAFARAGCPKADSPVQMAKEAIGTAIAAEKFGAQFFGEGAHPSSVYYVEDPDLTADGAKHIKNTVVAAQIGREPAVLGSGITRESIQVDPKDSQFLDLLRFEVEQACRFWGVPPSMAYAAISGQNIQYQNIQQADLQFLKYSAAIWLADLEDAWSQLIVPSDVVKFNVDALLRMDLPTRMTVYDKGLRNGLYSPNRVLTLEDEETYDGGDEHLWPPYRAFPIEQDQG